MTIVILVIVIVITVDGVCRLLGWLSHGLAGVSLDKADCRVFVVQHIVFWVVGWGHGQLVFVAIVPIVVESVLRCFSRVVIVSIMREIMAQSVMMAAKVNILMWVVHLREGSSLMAKSIFFLVTSVLAVILVVKHRCSFVVVVVMVLTLVGCMLLLRHLVLFIRALVQV